MPSYFKLRWPEDPVPDGEPQWIYYEVWEERDLVSRLVEEYLDGRLARRSIELARLEGSDQRDRENRSLVHGPFSDFARDHLEAISSKEFRDIWGRATDPF